MKKLHQLVATVGFLTIGFAAAIPQKASAVAVTGNTVNFTAQAGTGILAGNSYTGSFTYTGVGTATEILTNSDVTAFSFTLPSSYSISNVNSSLTFTNGILTAWEFDDQAGNNPVTSVSQTTPISFVVSSNQGIPNFLYGYDPVGGENYQNASGSCPDALVACTDAQGSSVGVPFEVPGGTAIPVFGSALALGVMGSLKKRIVSK